MGRAKLHSWCSDASTFKPPFWAGVQTTNSPSPYSSWELFSHTRLLQVEKKLSVLSYICNRIKPLHQHMRWCVLVHGRMSRFCFSRNSEINIKWQLAPFIPLIFKNAFILSLHYLSFPLSSLCLCLSLFLSLSLLQSSSQMIQFCFSVHFGTLKKKILNVGGQRSRSGFPDTKLALNRPLIVPLSQNIRLTGGLKLPLCVTRWCTGPAIDLWPAQSALLFRTAYSGSAWKGKGNGNLNAVPFFSSFSFNYFPFSLHPRHHFCYEELDVCIHSVSVSLSCKCTHYWEAKHNISYRHLSDCFSFAEQQRADGFSQLYSQLQNYLQFDQIASCFFGVLCLSNQCVEDSREFVLESITRPWLDLVSSTARVIFSSIHAQYIHTYTHTSFVF